MLSTAASNALLKTLEEPPGHVVFVLATTEAQKVLPTIRSRTQHFEFRLLGPDTLVGLLRKIRDEADLELDDGSIDAAVRRGRGSARDALSALDQVAAGGTVEDELVMVAALADALAERDPGRALVCVAQASEAGHDMAQLAGALADHLRQAFLASVAPDLVAVPSGERAAVEELARRMGLAAVVRHMEVLGQAQVDMREVPDPRVHLEVVVIRLAHPEADSSPAALLERIERLERVQGPGPPDGVPPGAEPHQTAPSIPIGSARPGESGPGDDASASADTTVNDPAPVIEATSSEAAVTGPELARRTLGAIGRPAPGPKAARRTATTPSRAPTDGVAVSESRTPSPMAPAAREAESSPAAPVTAAGRTGALATVVSRDELVQLWGDGLLASLPNRARARFRVGRFVAVDDGTAVFALPNETHRTYCEEVRVEVETALGSRFGTPVPLRLVVDEEAAADGPARPTTAIPGPEVQAEAPPVSGTEYDTEQHDLLDPVVLAAQTEPAGAGLSPEDRLKQAFPGAEEV
jgi:DNA polymerase-3 subunit gamma/tau